MTEQFYDGESEFNNDKNSYEEILLNQIRKTSEVLSQDLTMVVITDNKKGVSYKEDKRKIAINHIIILKHLLNPFIFGKPDFDVIESIEKDIEDYVNKLGELIINVQGKGPVKAKDLIHNSESILYNKLMEYKIERYKEMYGCLVFSYKKYKDEITALSTE